MQKKTELMLFDSRASVCVESDSENDLIVFSVTEYEVDGEKSTRKNEHLKPVSTTEIYISEKEATEIAKALLGTTEERAVI